MKAPLKIGITGGIGSGKTTITEVFRSLGVPVYQSDGVSKQLLDTDEDLKEAVRRHFGEDMYDSKGLLKRAALAAQVFGNQTKLELLNSITHPAVREHFLQWIQQQTHPYIVKEAAIMYESGANKDMDLMITVFAPKGLRQERVLKRGNITREEVEVRMSKQMSEEDKMKLANFTIINDDTRAVLLQVLDLHELFLQKARQ